MLQSGSVLLASEDRILYSINPHKKWIPASILKIATAWVAFETLGKNYRFQTDFSLANNQILIVAGFGDPFLVSEELQIIAQTLSNKLPSEISAILLDHSAFLPIKIPGISNTLNPYDARNGALVTNFNTINILVDKTNRITSAESQTPSLPIMQKLGKNLKQGKHRLNLSHSSTNSLQYTYELLQFFLQNSGVKVIQHKVSFQKPPKSKLIYRHLQTRNLQTIVQGMMKYSNNFIANQIFLTIGAKKYGYPASLQKGVDVVQSFLSQKLKNGRNWQIWEGSGISRKNRVSAQEFLELLRAFQPNYQTLPRYKNAYAKTGTLHGVYTLAGYIEGTNQELYPFVILLNQQKNTRYQILDQLLQWIK